MALAIDSGGKFEHQDSPLRGGSRVTNTGTFGTRNNQGGSEGLLFTAWGGVFTASLKFATFS